MTDLHHNLVLDIIFTNDNMIDFTTALGYIHHDYLKTDTYKKALPQNNLCLGYIYGKLKNVIVVKERYALIKDE